MRKTRQSDQAMFKNKFICPSSLFLTFFTILTVSTILYSYDLPSLHILKGRRVSTISRRELEESKALAARSFLDTLVDAGKEILGKVTGTDKANATDTSDPLTLLSNLLSGNTTALLDGLIGELATPAQFLGAGLADGIVAGVNNASVATPTSTGIDLVAQNLGSGLTKNLVGLINIPSSSTNSSSTTAASDQIGVGTLNGAALALAQGLGSGTSSALNLSSATTKASFNTSGLNGVAGNFGQGLTSTLLTGINMTKLISSISSLVGGSGSSSDSAAGNSSNAPGSSVREIAAGVGTGLGQGAAVGLGFQNMESLETETTGIAGTLQNFALGLTSGFLQNETLSRLAGSLTTSFSTRKLKKRDLDIRAATTQESSATTSSSLDVGAIAQGLAIGLLDGVGNTIAGQATLTTQDATFDDSVGGAATGFGRGLGSEGTSLIKQLLGESVTSSNSSSTRKRSLPAIVQKIQNRDISTSALISNLNATSVDPLLQAGLGAITCEGVGGLASLLLGLKQSKTINIDISGTKSSTNTTSASSSQQQIFNLTNGGNSYTIDLVNSNVTVNGKSLNQAIILLAFHILFAVTTYFVLAPVLVILISSQNISHLSGQAKFSFLNGVCASRIQISSGILLTVLTFSLGVVANGNSKHFSSAHKAMGLLVFIFSIATTILTPFKERTQVIVQTYKWLVALTMLLAVATLFTGFDDLRTYSFCIIQVLPPLVWVAVGILIMLPLILSMGVLGTEMLLIRTAFKQTLEDRGYEKKTRGGSVLGIGV